jgi:hypothetical protein
MILHDSPQKHVTGMNCKQPKNWIPLVLRGLCAEAERSQLAGWPMLLRLPVCRCRQEERTGGAVVPADKCRSTISYNGFIYPHSYYRRMGKSDANRIDSENPGNYNLRALRWKRS